MSSCTVLLEPEVNFQLKGNSSRMLSQDTTFYQNILKIACNSACLPSTGGHIPMRFRALRTGFCTSQKMPKKCTTRQQHNTSADKLSERLLYFEVQFLSWLHSARRQDARGPSAILKSSTPFAIEFNAYHAWCFREDWPSLPIFSLYLFDFIIWP